MTKRKTPAKKAAGKRALPNAKQAAFLRAYSRSGNITIAAQAAKIDRSQHYTWMQHDAGYPAKFEAAQTEAVELLEYEARYRAEHGVEEPIVYQGKFTFLPKFDKTTGEILRNEKGNPIYEERPLCIRKKSDVLLMFTLKALKPDVYRENTKLEVSGSLDVLVDRLTAGRARLAKREPAPADSSS
jgi:hypothetical protein